MLSRTADHLFWMSRYTERAENTARMLDVNYQTALLPQSAAVAKLGWEGLLRISERMARISGIPAGEMPAQEGKAVWPYVHPEDREITRDDLRQILAARQPHEGLYPPRAEHRPQARHFRDRYRYSVLSVMGASYLVDSAYFLADPLVLSQRLVSDWNVASCRIVDLKHRAWTIAPKALGSHACADPAAASGVYWCCQLRRTIW